MPGPIFTSTGPYGHRGRMRDRILAHGGDALADYEVLEMLLFLGIKRRDTKPLAKAMINRFGGLAEVLAAPPRALADAAGLDWRAILPLRLVEAAAERLARGEQRERPLLNGLDRVEAYLRGRTDDEGARLLYLDNRNRLLGDDPAPLDAEPSGADEASVQAAIRQALRRALELHATALLIADHPSPGSEARPDAATLDADRARAARRLRVAGEMLSIVLHDRVLLTEHGLASYRRAGLLAAGLVDS